MPRPNADNDTHTAAPTSIRLPASGVPPELVIEPVLEPRTVFRVTFATNPRDRSALLRSLSSNRELGQKPRKIERVYSVLHFALSTWTTEEAAYANAHAWPKNGDHIARLDLTPGLGICVNRPQPKSEHRSLWSVPDQILLCVTELKRA